MPEALRAIAALSLVIAALLAGAYGLQRLLSQRSASGSKGVSGSRVSRPDWAVIAWKGLDTKRKLALIRWGQTEYLLCLGPGGDCLIDQRVLTSSPEPEPEPQAILPDKSVS